MGIYNDTKLEIDILNIEYVAGLKKIYTESSHDIAFFESPDSVINSLIRTKRKFSEFLNKMKLSIENKPLRKISSATLHSIPKSDLDSKTYDLIDIKALIQSDGKTISALSKLSDNCFGKPATLDAKKTLENIMSRYETEHVKAMETKSITLREVLQKMPSIRVDVVSKSDSFWNESVRSTKKFERVRSGELKNLANTDLIFSTMIEIKLQTVIRSCVNTICAEANKYSNICDNAIQKTDTTDNLG